MKAEGNWAIRAGEIKEKTVWKKEENWILENKLEIIYILNVMIIINGNLKCTPIAVRDKRKKQKGKTVRERERTNAKKREVNGSAEGFFY